MKPDPRTPDRRRGNGPEASAETIAHLRAENQQLQELVTRALAKTAEYFLTIQRLRAGVTQEPQA